MLKQVACVVFNNPNGIADLHLWIEQLGLGVIKGKVCLSLGVQLSNQNQAVS